MKSDRGRFDNRGRPSQPEIEDTYPAAPTSRRNSVVGASELRDYENDYPTASVDSRPADSDDFDLRARRRRRAHRDAANFDKAAHTGPSRREKAPRRVRYPGQSSEAGAASERPARQEIPPDIAAAAAARSKAARQSRRKNWRRFAKTLIGVLALGLLSFLLTAPQFKITDVSVEGDPDLPVSAAMAVKNSIAGQNVFRVRFGRARGILTDLPPVRAVSVNRQWAWPPAVRVAIETRKPFARVGGGDVWWVADKDGIPFRPAGQGDEKLYAVAGPAFSPKLGVAIDAKHWQPVVEFADAMSQDARNGQAWNLRRVYFDRSGFASLRLQGGDNDETLVQLGVGEWPEKLKKARWALADFARSGKHAAVLNLISSDVTTWTPRVASASKATKENRAIAPKALDNSPAGDSTKVDNSVPVGTNTRRKQ